MIEIKRNVADDIHEVADQMQKDSYKMKEESTALLEDTISRQAAIDAVNYITSSMSVCVNTDECHGMKRMQRQAVIELAKLPSAQPEVRPIDYQDCSNVMLKMWMDNVVTDGEYNRIMDKLNAYWRVENG